MANPIYCRSPFGLMKRLRISPQFASRPSQCCHQRATFADVADLPSQTTLTPQELAEQPSTVVQTPPSEVVNEATPSVAERKHVKKQQPPPPPGFTHLGPVDPRTKELLYNTPLPPNVQAVYLKPLRRAPTHSLPVCDLQLRSYSIRNLEFFADYAMRAAYYLGLPAKGPVPLPQITERWTVPRSPFIHKKSQENFERKTLRRLIQIQDGHAEVVQAWLAYLEKRVYYGVGMKANVYEWEGVDVLGGMEREAQEFAREAEEQGVWEEYGMRDKWALQELEKNVAEMKVADLIAPGVEPERRFPVEIAGRSK